MPRPRDVTTTLTTFTGAEHLTADQPSGNVAKVTTSDARKWFGDGAVNAKEYGVATANTAAANATAMIAALATGKDVILEGPGTYQVTYVTVATARQRLIGVGKPTLQRATVSNDSVVYLDAAGCQLQGVRVDGNSLATNCVMVRNAGDQVIEDCELYSATDPIQVYLAAARIENNIVRNFTSDGINVAANAPCLIAGNEIHDNTHGQGIFIDGQFVLTAGEMGHRVTNNHIYNINATSGSGEYGNGVLVYFGGQVVVNANTIHDCDFSFVRVHGATGVDVDGNTCWTAGETGIWAEFGWSNVSIRGNNVLDTVGYSISVVNAASDGARGAVVQANVVKGNATGIFVEAAAVVADNQIDCAGDAGIQLGFGSCWDLHVHDNQITDTQVVPTLKVGIAIMNDVAGTYRNVAVARNTINNTTLAPIGGHEYGDVTNGAAAYPIPAYAVVTGVMEGGVQSVAYAASITPNVWLGDTVNVGALTGNVTIVTPTTGLAAGQRLTLVFTQDGTGGRTITLPAAWFFNWTPTTTASHKNSITVIYDGTSWVQVAAQTGLT